MCSLNASGTCLVHLHLMALTSRHLTAYGSPTSRSTIQHRGPLSWPVAHSLTPLTLTLALTITRHPHQSPNTITNLPHRSRSPSPCDGSPRWFGSLLGEFSLVNGYKGKRFVQRKLVLLECQHHREIYPEETFGLPAWDFKTTAQGRGTAYRILPSEQ